MPIAGNKYGKLTVLKRVENAILPSGKQVTRYLCRCDCGNEKVVRKCHLVSGATISCGCAQKEKAKSLNRKHGYSNKERLYRVWLNIKDRCGNPNNNHYESYGGRGIAICDEWKNDYESFRKWCLLNGYVEDIKPNNRNNLTIDRIDVNGNYEPNNCRFVTNQENCLNKRDTMSDSERNKICPICGNSFQVKRRNEKKTCSALCGAQFKKIYSPQERSLNGRFVVHT